MTKIAGTILKLINIVVVLVYLSACLIPVLPAGRFWMISGLGLVFPLLALIVAGFFVAWLMARSKWCLLSLAALALSWQQLSVIGGFNFRKEFTYSKNSKTLRVFSWNVSGWGETNKSPSTIPNYWPLIMGLIKQQNPDVLCLQEFWDTNEPNSNISVIRAFKKMGYPYWYFAKSFIGNRALHSGVAIVSRYPITDTAKFTYGPEDFAEHLIYADIQFHQQKIRIFTTHLQSVRFENEQYTAIRKIRQKDESGLKGSKVIVRKLKNAYWYRGFQADFVQQKIKESPYPVIISGDFNDVPNSYTYFTIKGDLNDAFVKKGTGLGRTFMYLSPTLRIDYILADKIFRVEQFDRLLVPYSDHYPIVADLRL